MRRPIRGSIEIGLLGGVLLPGLWRVVVVWHTAIGAATGRGGIGSVRAGVLRITGAGLKGGTGGSRAVMTTVLLQGRMEL